MRHPDLMERRGNEGRRLAILDFKPVDFGVGTSKEIDEILSGANFG